MENIKTDKELFERTAKYAEEQLSGTPVKYEVMEEQIVEKNNSHLDAQPVDEAQRGEYNFSKDLKKGEDGEDFLIKFIASKGPVFIRKSSKKIDGEQKEFDLLFLYNNKNVTYETKTDMYPDTGNLVVEFEDRGKPSGISVTKADYFMTYFTKRREIWNIKTSKLKQLIAENNFNIVRGGDGKKAKMYQIPREQFTDYFKVHII